VGGRTVLVLGDQLGRGTGALARAEPGRDRVLMVETVAKLRERPFHRAKVQLVWSALRHLAEELRDEGFDVTYRMAPTMRSALAGEDPDRVVVMAPSSWDGRRRFADLGIEQVPNDAYIVGEEAFARWAGSRRSLLLESFYRDVRREHGWLMDGTDPVGGRWNHDEDNRRPPPREGVDPPRPYLPRETAIDEAVRRDLARLEREHGLDLRGSAERRLFPATADEARRSLRSFLDRRIEGFGPLEDAVVDDEPFLWHSLLSAPLNLGLLHPAEVCDAVDAAYRRRRTAGAAPHLPSYEGFLRQVCGWREYVWGLYWWRMPAWRTDDALGQRGGLPPGYWDGETDLRCVAETVRDVLDRGWVHHIPRLMILGNHALLAGTDPHVLTEWFHGMFVDGYDWVMQPNVVGMSQWADGGVMATKPYAASASYINRMTTYCGDCVFDPKTRTAEDSCPYNSLYWDFLSRNRATLSTVRRMAMPLRTLDRFDDAERRRIRDRARRFRTDGDVG
jgi:deoxyribodipyrimidine photolyase-related protein